MREKERERERVSASSYVESAVIISISGVCIISTELDELEGLEIA